MDWHSDVVKQYVAVARITCSMSFGADLINRPDEFVNANRL